MSKDIWHTSDEKPNDGFDMVVYYSKKYDEELLVGYYNTEYEEFRPLDEYYCEEKTVKKWSFLNDLLALETELDRTRKALDKAKDGLEYLFTYDDDVLPVFVLKHIMGVLDQIKATLEQKEQKNDR